MDDVLKFRQSLSQNIVAAKSTEKRQLESVSSSTTSDEVLLLSPKRSKLNISSLDPEKYPQYEHSTGKIAGSIGFDSADAESGG
jgi:DNA polymerase III sliding clamp (beta) subunit (PCNA family)